jgi:Domain of unknown function (DUF4253)
MPENRAPYSWIGVGRVAKIRSSSAVKFRANLRLAEQADGTIVAEILTPETLGPEPVADQGVLEPSDYLTERHINLTNFVSEALGRMFPALTASIPRNGRSERIVDRPFDLSAGSEERRLVEKLVRQERLEVRWVNEGVTVDVGFHEGLRRGWQKTLDEMATVTQAEWIGLLASVRYDFSEWPGGIRPSLTPKRRVVPEPSRPVPFYSRRSGAIPRAGRASLAGVRLPKGSRHPPLAPAYWVSDERVGDATGLAAQLAEVFDRTGVWPLLWLYEEDPEAYMQQPADVALIDEVEVETLLRHRWEYLNSRSPGNESIFGAAPPELAPLSPTAPTANARFFERLPADTSARLLLAPCNRPADAITVIGGLDAELTGPEISAVLRSWEERIRAAPVAVQPSAVWVGIESPPRSSDQAAMLAAEFNVIAPLPPESGTEALADVAAAMTAKPSQPPAFRFRPQTHLWPIGWYD